MYHVIILILKGKVIKEVYGFFFLFAFGEVEGVGVVDFLFFFLFVDIHVYQRRILGLGCEGLSYYTLYVLTDGSSTHLLPFLSPSLPPSRA